MTNPDLLRALVLLACVAAYLALGLVFYALARAAARSDALILKGHSP